MKMIIKYKDKDEEDFIIKNIKNIVHHGNLFTVFHEVENTKKLFILKGNKVIESINILL